ncbi:hypothetical protein [Pseudoxanthomonas sp. X-1]|uniref:hypothetical protein n=1 Tax=Pseudoxanthomonas sp. X-1 TaxID=2571115 RepID=UPI00110B1F97|nr:hypothetical protein [Pseudoxanthomonas sp. X-1]TMN20301.1 hypothetical protein FF950_08800 [Pseudoxanthomonas sp. X-1]UAY73507.1 hypothetical protein LAJ50_13495 [Pseudoxanthomonas sp. X-1]
MRPWRALLAPLLAAVLLAGCAAPANTQGVQPSPATDPAPAPAPGAQTGSNATPAPSRPPSTPAKVQTQCTSDAQCVVKNIGSCCGELPACVNVDSPTDPAAVQAQCQASGRMGICGFRPISACQCQAGTCQPAGDGAGSLTPASSAPLQIR